MRDMKSAPRDGTRIDVWFDPETAERDHMGSMADFYAAGSSRGKADPVIRDVFFTRNHFRPYTPEGDMMACDMAVTLTGWNFNQGANN